MPPAEGKVGKVKQEQPTPSGARENPPASSNPAEDLPLKRTGIARDIDMRGMYQPAEDVDELKQKLFKDYGPLTRNATSGGPCDSGGRPIYPEFCTKVNGNMRYSGETDCEQFLQPIISVTLNLADAYNARVRLHGRSEKYWDPQTAQWSTINVALEAISVQHRKALKEVISFFFR